MVTTTAIKGALWLQSSLSEIGAAIRTARKIGCDIQRCLAFLSNLGEHACGKHYALKFHFVLDWTTVETVDFYFLPTESMVADSLIKGVSVKKLELCRRSYGLSA